MLLDLLMRTHSFSLQLVELIRTFSGLLLPKTALMSHTLIVILKLFYPMMTHKIVMTHLGVIERSITATWVFLITSGHVVSQAIPCH